MSFGSPAENYAEAARWYGKAAEQGDASAQCEFAVCLYNGDGCPRDLQRAADFAAKAAEAAEGAFSDKAREILERCRRAGICAVT